MEGTTPEAALGRQQHRPQRRRVAPVESEAARPRQRQRVESEGDESEDDESEGSESEDDESEDDESEGDEAEDDESEDDESEDEADEAEGREGQKDVAEGLAMGDMVRPDGEGGDGEGGAQEATPADVPADEQQAAPAQQARQTKAQEASERDAKFHQEQRGRVHAPAIAESGMLPWGGVSVEVAQLVDESKVRCEPLPRAPQRPALPFCWINSTPSPAAGARLWHDAQD